MTPEEKSLLQRALKLSEENNSILRSMRRSNRVSMFLRIIYWLIIIGLSVGAYYFIQPYVSVLQGLLGGNKGSSSSAATSGGLSSLSPESVQDAAASLKQLLQQAP